VDTIFAAMQNAQPGETYIPRVPAARMVDLANVLMNGRKVRIVYTGIRPGEKIHEILVSEEECGRTVQRDGYYVICPMLPELHSAFVRRTLTREYSSSDITVGEAELADVLAPYVDAHFEGERHAHETYVREVCA
jgi:FlaA1/EpsC-like NDP-sugar epimerase